MARQVRRQSRDEVPVGINSFFLADRAELVNNRLDVMGGFTGNVWMQRFPAVHVIGIALLLRVPSVRAGTPVDWSIRIADPLNSTAGTLSIRQ
jgi:hypothetical protein